MKSLSQIQTDYFTTAYQMIVPEAALVGMACLLFLLGLIAPRRGMIVFLGFVGLALAAMLTLMPSVGGAEIARFWEPVAGTSLTPQSIAPFDPTGAALFVRWLAMATGAILLLLAWDELRDGMAAEFTACLLIVIAGTSLVGRANDLVSLFLSLEMISIPTYVMLYLPLRTRAAQESSLKYFMLSILSSGILLFGMSYLYGLAGTTNLGGIIATLTSAHAVSVNPLSVIAIVMVIAGLSFRLTLVPFHFYAPDVYQGGPTSVVSQLAFIPKIAGFVALARVLGMLSPPVTELPFDADATLIPVLLWFLAIVTMTFGNIMALLQDDIRRLLAYSGIAHAGYMLMGVVVACSLPDTMSRALPVQLGMDAVFFYLAAYGLMTVGAFAVLLHLATRQEERGLVNVDDLAGLGTTHPVSAGILSITLFSMIGLPLTAGFIGKFLLFLAAFDAPSGLPMGNMYRLLAVVAAVNAAIGAVYYLRLIGVMYLRTALKPLSARPWSPTLAAALICAIGTVVHGVYPKPLSQATRAAIPLADVRPDSGPATARR